MPSGPFGGPRPFAQYKLIIDPFEPNIYVMRVGPFGGPRPLATNNPAISEERVQECVVSEGGEAFGAGVVTGGSINNIEDLPPQDQERAFNLAIKWCKGVLEATSEEQLPAGEETATFKTLKSNIENNLRSEGIDGDLESV